MHDFFCQKEKEYADRDMPELPPVTDADTAEARKKVVEKKMLNSAKIIERMLNLNTFEDVARDFRFYEDPADEYKSPEGSLMPLWNFRFEAEKELEATHLMWSPNYSDLFAVSLGTVQYTMYINRTPDQRKG